MSGVSLTAASRFDGGPFVKLGFALCFAAFGGAIAVVLLAFQLDRGRWRGLTVVISLLSFGAIAALWLPAYEGVSGVTGSLRVETGWSGLDPVSLVGIVAMAVVTIVPRVSPQIVAGAAASQAGLFVGNLLIQAFTERPTSLRFGLPVASGLSAAAFLTSLTGVRETGA
jgi:hypothetical protein